MVRPTGYLNVSTRFFFTVTCRHFTGHTALTGQGKPHEPGFFKEERERRTTLSLTRQGKPGFAERQRERRASETAEGD